MYEGTEIDFVFIIVLIIHYINLTTLCRQIFILNIFREYIVHQYGGSSATDSIGSSAINPKRPHYTMYSLVSSSNGREYYPQCLQTGSVKYAIYHVMSLYIPIWLLPLANDVRFHILLYQIRSICLHILCRINNYLHTNQHIHTKEWIWCYINILNNTLTIFAKWTIWFFDRVLDSFVAIVFLFHFFFSIFLTQIHLGRIYTSETHESCLLHSQVIVYKTWYNQALYYAVKSLFNYDKSCTKSARLQ